MRKQVILIPFLILTMLPACSLNKEVKTTNNALIEDSKIVKVPYQESIIKENQKQFQCSPMLKVGIWVNMTNLNSLVELEPVIEGSVGESTTTHYIKISEDGTALGEITNPGVGFDFDDYPWQVLSNDERSLTAIWFYPPDRIDTLTLNKENGLAAFTRNIAHFFFGGSPKGDVYYTLCE